VGFADVKAFAVPVIAHRLVLSYEAGLSGTTAANVINEIVLQIPELSG
jgi:MoxR-like ATPase